MDRLLGQIPGIDDQMPGPVGPRFRIQPLKAELVSRSILIIPCVILLLAGMVLLKAFRFQPIFRSKPKLSTPSVSLWEPARLQKGRPSIVNSCRGSYSASRNRRSIFSRSYSKIQLWNCW